MRPPDAVDIAGLADGCAGALEAIDIADLSGDCTGYLEVVDC